VIAFPGDAANSSTVALSTDHKFWNANGADATKIEHTSADPRGGQRFVVQTNMSPGFILMYDMPTLKTTLDGLSGRQLPTSFTGHANVVVSYGDKANYTIITGGGAKNKGGAYSGAQQSGTGSTSVRRVQSINQDEQLKIPTIVDTLQWYATAEGNWLYFGEDGGAWDGEACWLAKFNPNNLTANGGKVPIYFMSQLTGGTTSSKFKQTIPSKCHVNGLSPSPLLSSTDVTSEYSGSWDLTGLLLKNVDGSFKASTTSRIREIDSQASINDKLIMLGTQPHYATGGVIAAKGLGEGGQLIMLKPKGLPIA
jgi:hypothetical protein